MKILFVCNGYPPLHTAGTENYTAGIASAFARAGIDVTVVCAGDWDVGPEPLNGLNRSVHEGVSIIRLNLNWTKCPDPNRSLYDNPIVAACLRKILDECTPDVVHVTSCYTLSASVLRVVKEQGYPLILTLTDYWFLCPRVSLLRGDGVLCDGRTTAWECLRCMLWDARAYHLPNALLPETVVRRVLTAASHRPWISRRRGLRGMALNMEDRKTVLPQALDLPDVLIAPSAYLAQVIAGNGIRRPIRVITHGHDLRWERNLEKRHRKLPAMRFGYAGRITASKGVHVLVEAASRINGRESFETRIWGSAGSDGRYMKRLRDLAASSSAIKFCGSFRRDQLAEVFGEMDSLVVPSIWHENNPLVIQEAFAASVPVIASNLGGMAEFVEHEKNGLLFEPGNPQALAKAMTRLMEEPGLLARLRKGIPPVKTVQQEVEELSGIYHGVIQVQR